MIRNLVNEMGHSVMKSQCFCNRGVLFEGWFMMLIRGMIERVREGIRETERAPFHSKGPPPPSSQLPYF